MRLISGAFSCRCRAAKPGVEVTMDGTCMADVAAPLAAAEEVSQVRLKVQPVANGWQVHCDLPLETSYFRSGARAERAARELAIRLSALGHDVQLIIEDRAGRVVGTQIYFALDDASLGG